MISVTTEKAFEAKLTPKLAPTTPLTYLELLSLGMKLDIQLDQMTVVRAKVCKLTRTICDLGYGDMTQNPK